MAVLQTQEGYLFLFLFLTIFILRVWAKGGINTYPGSVKNKVIIVTGANTGIGYECVKEFA